jgi:hypothetical protein
MIGTGAAVAIAFVAIIVPRSHSIAIAFIAIVVPMMVTGSDSHAAWTNIDMLGKCCGGKDEERGGGCGQNVGTHGFLLVNFLPFLAPMATARNLNRSCGTRRPKGDLDNQKTLTVK